MIGTATPTALVSFGTTSLLPIYIRLAPLMTLYPELSVKVNQGHIIIPPQVATPEIMNLNDTAGSLPAVELGDLPVEFTNSNQSEEPDKNGFERDSGNHGNKKQVRASQKDANLLNSFLPPILALMTLKDAVLDYYFGAESTTTDADLDDLEQTTDLDSRSTSLSQNSEFCSAGPCLMDSWPNCWNVSSEFDWSEYLAYSSQCCRDEQPCCYKCVLNSNLYHNHDNNLHINHGHVDNLDNGLDKASVIKCCCKRPYSESASWFKGSLNSAIIDLNLRFSTQSLYPVYVTT